ncbi:Eukaryotic aspartyl protease [Aphelenchoides besseyi]|nr:Eukaryotic aspartyl protease [Aphelenchoides besseyi]
MEAMTTGFTIGEYEQLFFVSYESGVDSAWILDESYPSFNDGPGWRFNATGVNTTAIDAGRPFEALSGPYKVHGELYYDIVEEYEFINQSFGVVNKIDGKSENPEFHWYTVGVLGFGWNPALKDEPVTPDSSPTLNIFAHYFPGQPRYIIQELCFFESDGQWYIGNNFFSNNISTVCDTTPIVSVPLSLDTKLNTLTFQLDSFTFGKYETYGETAKFDTALPIFLLPVHAFNIVYNDIQPDYNFDVGVYTTDCANRGKFGDFIFKIGGVQLTVPSAYYIVDIGLNNGQCSLSVGYTYDDSTPYALGLPLQYNYCVKWDVDNTEIAFLQNKYPNPHD